MRNSGYKPDSKAFHEFAFGKLHGIEKSDRMVRVAMTDMRLHGDGTATFDAPTRFWISRITRTWNPALST